MNTKKIKKSVKQSTKNNYRIEALEPRLMMSADAPIDLSDNNAVDNQLSALYVSLESCIDNSVSNQTNTIGYQIHCAT